MADIQRYLNLITSEHGDKPRLIAWLTASLSIIDDILNLVDSMNTHFNLETAVGLQLDILGGVIGRSRALDFQPTDGSSSVLDDDYYRLILQTKIAQNQWDGTIEQIYAIWYTIFENVYLILKDNQNMSMDALILGISSDLEKDLVTNGYIVPKPEGVKVNYAYSENPLFAYGLDNDNFKGYGEGYWVEYF